MREEFKLSIQSVRRGRKKHDITIEIFFETVKLNLGGGGVPGLSGWTVLLCVFPKR